MLVRPRPLSRFTATVAAAALSFGLLAATPGVAWAEDKTTFLGLEGEGDPVTALADAIRWDLNQRGRDDGNTMSLAELKLTMGCGDDDLPCLAQGGQALGSQEFVFGTMNRSGAAWTIKLQSLNIGTGELNNAIEREVSAADLSEASLGKTAASLIDELYKITPTAADMPPVGDDSTTDGATDGATQTDVQPDDEPRRSGRVIWGPYSPRPAWKFVGVGISGAITLAALGTAIGTTIQIGPNGSIREDLLAAAQASIEDDRPSNDIDPNIDGDLCPLARLAPDPTCSSASRA